MRKGGGKAKGSAFERKICEELSRWVDPKGSDSHFWRSAMSGGRATVRGRKGKTTHSQVGDISSITLRGAPFVERIMVECKHVKNLRFAQAAISGAGPLGEFWSKLRDDADHHDKVPLLIARQNGLPILAILRTQDAIQFFGMANAQLAKLYCLDPHTVGIYRFNDLMVRRYREDRFK